MSLVTACLEQAWKLSRANPPLRKRVTIFQTQDPYASEDKWDLQFIAYRKIILENYQLDSEALCKVSGEIFWVRRAISLCEKKQSIQLVL